MIGETYATLFPRRVRALVLDGVVDPVAWSSGRGEEARTVPVSLRIRSAESTTRALREFFALCTRAAAACVFSHGNPRARWEGLARRLRAQPIQLADGRTFTYQDLLIVTYGSMPEPSLWPQLAKWLQAIDTGTGPVPPATSASYDPTHWAVICSDSDNPASADAWRRAAAAADRRLPQIGRAVAWDSSICLVWHALDTDRYTGPWTRRTSPPLLLVANRYDPETPLINAKLAARLFPRARLLVIDGWGHLSLNAPSTCAAKNIERYLLTTRLPHRAAVCSLDVTPFASPSRTAPPAR
jgi:pimeloyl-ACP methyl ester carboxylesterase